MSYIVDFKNVSTVGLESSPAAEALAGLRANEARYFMNKYEHEFEVVPASESGETLDYVNRVLKERDIAFAAKPLETSRFQVENIKFAYVFYEDGPQRSTSCIRYGDTKKRAVGFKLSEGMEVPGGAREGKFKFARQKSKLAGTIRGSFFVIKGEILISPRNAHMISS